MQRYEIPKKYEYLFFRIEAELPRKQNEIAGIEDFMVPMRDGICLHTQVFFPKGYEKTPTILIRNPYVSDILRLQASVSHFARFGYTVVLQSCRGTGKSEGEWIPFCHEKQDGIDTLNWLIAQTWQDGNIGMFGFSYLSFCQYVLADVLPREVKTLFLDKLGINRYGQLYMNGMFRHEFYTAWTVRIAQMEKNLNRGEIYQKSLQLLPHKDMDKILFGEEISFYREVLDNVEQKTDFWLGEMWSGLIELAQTMPVPLLMCAGWFDHQITGMIHTYKQLPEKIRQESGFIIGPWDHLGMTAGEYPFKNERVMGSMAIKTGLEWYDYRLKGISPQKNLCQVSLYQCGKDSWTKFDNYPQVKEKEIVYLYSEKTICKKKQQEQTVLYYTYNPNNPVKTKGGNSMMAWMFSGFEGAPHGSVKQSDYVDREDVLTFFSDTFEEDLSILGTICAYLYVATDVKDTAFAVKVMEVTESGDVYNLADGISSLKYRNHSYKPQDYTPLETVEIKIEMWDIFWCFKKGTKLRIDISSSNFPAYHLHRNTEKPWQEETEMKIAHQSVFFGGKTPTRLELPVWRKNINTNMQ